MMGVGLEWKANLIKDLAKLSEGKWYYIDVNQAAEAERVFVEEFEQLAATAFMNVEMHLRPMKDIKIKRVRQVVPGNQGNADDRAGRAPSDGAAGHAAEGSIVALRPGPELAEAARRQVRHRADWRSPTISAWGRARAPA